MLGSKFGKALILGVCITLFSSAAVFAETDTVKTEAVSAETVSEPVKDQVPPDAAVSSPAQEISKEIYLKQNEIDQYVFEQHKDEIAGMGITVTHTAPFSGYVEVGITPFTEENSEYFYKLFGRDKVKVVEGIQATTFDVQIASAGVAEAGQSSDTPAGAQTLGAPNNKGSETPVDPQVTSAQGQEVYNANVVLAKNDAPMKATSEAGPASTANAMLATAVAILLVGGFILTRRFKTAKR